MSMAMDYELPPWSEPKAVADSMRSFLEGKLKGFSARQILTATNYCLFGCDTLKDETPIMPSEEDVSKTDG